MDKCARWSVVVVVAVYWVERWFSEDWDFCERWDWDFCERWDWDFWERESLYDFWERESPPCWYVYSERYVGDGGG